MFCFPNQAAAGEEGYMEKRLRWFDEGASRLRLVLDRQGIGDQLPSTASPASGAVSPPGIRSSPREGWPEGRGRSLRGQRITVLLISGLPHTALPTSFCY